MVQVRVTSNAWRLFGYVLVLFKDVHGGPEARGDNGQVVESCRSIHTPKKVAPVLNIGFQCCSPKVYDLVSMRS